MQALLRLAGWGVAATAAVLLVVIAANSSVGRERLSVAFAGINGTRASEAAKAEAAQAAHFARVAAIEGDTRRLTEIVRSLAGDRERLLTRLATIERGLEDVTGSIKRQAEAPPAATPRPPAAAAEPPPKTAAAPPQTVVPAQPAAAPPPPEPPNRVASAPPSGGVPELEAIQPRPAAGVDIGGATSFDGLRTLWNAITSNHYGLFEGLQPIVTVRENSKSRTTELRLVAGPLTDVEIAKSRTAELRLVAGPLTDVEIANRICTTLAAAKRYCRLVAFEGHPLALQGAEPRRPAAAKPRPTAKASP